MFESAGTKDQWLTDLEYELEDLEEEINRNPFGASKAEINQRIKKFLEEVNE